MTYPTIEEVRARMSAKDRAFCAQPNAAMEIIIREVCDLDRELRGGDGERIDWAEHPWMKFATADEDGRTFGFEYCPSRHDGVWLPFHGGRCERINATIPGPWTESLRKRPENV